MVTVWYSCCVCVAYTVWYWCLVAYSVTYICCGFFTVFCSTQRGHRSGQRAVTLGFLPSFDTEERITGK